MPAYAKICPKCNGSNREEENICSTCGQFLGMVRAVPVPEAAPRSLENRPSEPKAEPGEAFADRDQGERRRGSTEPASLPRDEHAPRLRLECASTGATFAIEDGSTVGQAHPTSRAEVQMAGIPNINYVSRHHCRLNRTGGAWFVTALPGALNGTAINGVPVAPGGRARLRDGDELLMANVAFRVKIEDR